MSDPQPLGRLIDSLGVEHRPAEGELVLGANPAIWMYGAGPMFAGVLHRNGIERDKKIAQMMIDKGWVRVVESGDGRILGFIARNGEEIDALFVAAPERGQGVGVALLDDAKARANRLELWTFQRNTGAQKFYEREGFAEVTRSDGAGNQEQLPDVRYAWEAKT